MKTSEEFVVSCIQADIISFLIIKNCVLDGTEENLTGNERLLLFFF